MKTLLLVRHAKTESPFSWKRDYDRCLTNAGMQDAVRVGRWLRSKPIQVDWVISSSAERARHTTKLLCNELDIEEKNIEFKEELYHAAPDVFTKVIKSITNNKQTVLIVAHNDGITHFANQLTTARIDHMQPGSAFAITCPCSTWEEFSDAHKTFLFYRQPT